MSSGKEQMTQILYAALSSRFGLFVRSNDPIRHRQRFYHVKSQLRDDSLKFIQIRICSSPDADLVVVREDEMENWQRQRGRDAAREGAAAAPDPSFEDLFHE